MGKNICAYLLLWSRWSGYTFSLLYRYFQTDQKQNWKEDKWIGKDTASTGENIDVISHTLLRDGETDCWSAAPSASAATDDSSSVCLRTSNPGGASVAWTPYSYLQTEVSHCKGQSVWRSVSVHPVVFFLTPRPPVACHSLRAAFFFSTQAFGHPI